MFVLFRFLVTYFKIFQILNYLKQMTTSTKEEKIIFDNFITQFASNP